MTEENAIRWCRGVFYLSMCAFTAGIVVLLLPYLWGEGWLPPASIGYKIFGWLLACGVVVGGTSALFLMTSERH